MPLRRVAARKAQTFSPVPKPTAKAKQRKPITRSPVKGKGPPKAQDRAYLDWVAGQFCAVYQVAGAVGNRCMLLPGRHKLEAAHVKTKGSGGADRGNTVCLCPRHHDEQEGDTEGFEKVYGVNLRLEAAKLLVKYIEEGNE
jgi:hypothetical protein